MIIKKKYAQITTYQQDKEERHSVVDQNLPLQKTVSKKVVVISKIK